MCEEEEESGRRIKEGSDGKKEKVKEGGGEEIEKKWRIEMPEWPGKKGSAEDRVIEK
jgi:hypothetical protein